MSEKTGVERAIEIAGGGAEGRKALADLFETSVPFIHNCEKKGYFPPERAKQVARSYPDLKVIDLVHPRYRDVFAAL